MRIFDLHNDALTAGGRASRKDVIYAVWTSKLTEAEVFAILGKAEGKFIAIEDAHFVSASNLQRLIDGKPLYVSLTWNGENRFAGGVMTKSGLTKEGKWLISALNEANISLDVAHLGRAALGDAIATAKRPICSHTCFDGVQPHLRNLCDDTIKKLVGRGGIIGLCFVGSFLGGRSIEDVCRHVDYYVKKFGYNGLCIGSDFFGSDELPPELSDYSEFDKLAAALLAHGHTACGIEKIFYYNAYNYFRSTI